MINEMTLPELSSILGVSSQAVGKFVRDLIEKDLIKHSSVIGKRRYVSWEGIRTVLQKRGWRVPKKTILFHTVKGGAGKTTISTNVAYRMAQLGAKVLLVDLDKQANATHTLIGLNRPPLVFIDLVCERAIAKDIIVYKSDNFAILPSSLANARLETELIRLNVDPRNYYKTLLQSVYNDFDVIIIDLPPDINRSAFFATCFADEICIPVPLEEYSIEGANETIQAIRGVNKEFPDFNKKVHIIWSKFDARKKNSLELIQSPRQWQSTETMGVIIRSDSAYENAQSDQKTVFELKKKTNAYVDMDMLAQELLGVRRLSSEKGDSALMN